MSFDLLQYRKNGLIFPSLWEHLIGLSFSFRSSLFTGTPRLNSVHGLYYGVVCVYFYDNGLLFSFRPFGALGYMGWNEFARFVFRICQIVFSGLLTGVVDFRIRYEGDGGLGQLSETFSLSVSSTFISSLSSQLHNISLKGGDLVSEREVFLLIRPPGVLMEDLKSNGVGSLDLKYLNGVLLDSLTSRYIWEAFFKKLGIGESVVWNNPCIKYGKMEKSLLFYCYTWNYIVMTPFSEFETNYLTDLVRNMAGLIIMEEGCSVDIFYLDFKGGLMISKGSSKYKYSGSLEFISYLNSRIESLRYERGASFYRVFGMKISCS